MELLAVIVILSITLVIAVPKIQNIVSDSKKETFTKDINSVITELKRVYQNEFAGALGTNTQTYTVTNGVWTNNGNTLNIFDGKKELTGSVTIDSDGNTKLALHNSNYCAVKLINSTEPDIMNFKTSCGLPDTYQQVEYIQSSGTQWINLDMTATPQTIANLDIDITEIITCTGIIGSYNGNSANNYYIFIAGNGNYQIGFGSLNTLSTVPVIGRQKLALKNDKFIINDNVKNLNLYNNNFTISNNLYFLNISGGSYSKLKAKIYNLKITENDILVRNMIPCYRISDNVIGMYDLVNNEFYTNAGSGTFVKGSNV